MSCIRSYDNEMFTSFFVILKHIYVSEVFVEMGVKVFFFFVIILSEGFLITLVICVYE